MRGARRYWALLVVAGVVAVVVANVALLGLASERNDPVGRLQPVTTLDLGGSTSTAPGRTTPEAPTTTGSTETDDRGNGPGRGEPDD